MAPEIFAMGAGAEGGAATGGVSTGVGAGAGASSGAATGGVGKGVDIQPAMMATTPAQASAINAWWGLDKLFMGCDRSEPVFPG